MVIKKATKGIYGPLTRSKPKPKKQRGYGQASEGRTRKAGGGSGSVASRLSKAGPVAKPN